MNVCKKKKKKRVHTVEFGINRRDINYRGEMWSRVDPLSGKFELTFIFYFSSFSCARNSSYASGSLYQIAPEAK